MANTRKAAHRSNARRCRILIKKELKSCESRRLIEQIYLKFIPKYLKRDADFIDDKKYFV